MTKKVVLKVHIHDEKEKQKAMKAVSSLSGIESLAMDMKEKKLTVIGDVDPVQVVSKLRKHKWHTDLLTVGPAKEPEKKKEDDKKNDASKKKEDEKKKTEHEHMAEFLKHYNNYNNYYPQQYYHSAEENPNSCVIC